MSGTIETKLASLGILADSIQHDIEILTNSSNMIELRTEKNLRGWGTASVDQYLSRIFRPLYEQDSGIRDRAVKGLAHLEVHSDIVTAFFTTYNQASINLQLAHQDIPENKKEKFIEEANQLSLKILKEYLGV